MTINVDNGLGIKLDAWRVFPAPRIPLAQRYARAKAWASRARTDKVNALLLKAMVQMERSNRG